MLRGQSCGLCIRLQDIMLGNHLGTRHARASAITLESSTCKTIFNRATSFSDPQECAWHQGLKNQRLIFEASTYVLAELKMQVSAPEVEEASRKMPFVEKRARLLEHQTRLGGLKIEGNMCPSHALMTLLIAWRSREPSFICLLRSVAPGIRRLRATTSPSPSSSLKNIQLTVVPGDALEPIDVGSKLKCLWALQRRGIALGQTEILSRDVRKSWVHQLFNTLSQEAPVADRGLFVLLTHEVSEPLDRLLVRQNPWTWQCVHASWFI